MAQTKPLPIGEFEWLTDEDREEEKWLEYEQEDEYGFIVEVDLDYPDYLHGHHNSFPLAVERVKIDESMLSEYAADCHKLLRGGREKYSAEKLTATFNPRKKYVTHIFNLQTYLKLGMELTKVHRVLRFRQAPFLKPYIEFCTAKRAASTSKFQENLQKFFANAVFGKTIENVRSHSVCKFVRNKKSCGRYIASPRFKHFKIISENCAIVFLSQSQVKLNKPIAVGFTILELAKEFMYSQYYNTIKPIFNNQCEVIMHDTDSLLMRVSTPQAEDNIEKIKHILDFSKYPKTHPKYNIINKNRLGFFKDEVAGNHITEVCALRSKVYSLQIDEGDTKVKTENRCKGIRKGYSKKIPFAAFKKCVLSITNHRTTQYNIMSRNHNVTTNKVNKLSFSSFCDKRSLAICGIHSYPYGSILIKKNYCYLCVRDNVIVKRL
ncbi:MAG: hypothetical protein COA94_02405 [Rickettsiales bacterium]|nr:MAG: hypothetical protein COA94_02405 [Rickettsiales bacterium]